MVLVAILLLTGIVFTLFSTSTSTAAEADIHLVWLGRYQGTGAEISAYDPITRRLFVTGAGSQVEVLDLSDPAAPALVTTFSFDATSVAVKNGILALAVPDPADKTNPGHVYLYDTSSLVDPSIVAVGALPDMLTFTPDGRRILVANEGEPGDVVDPEGSVSILDIGQGIDNIKVKTASFKRFNDLRADLITQGVRIFPNAASVAQDLEPEFIAVSPDGNRAYITLQENNAIAVLQIPASTFQAILPLGLKDHSQPGSGLDASDRDSKINIQNWRVFGMYMPDGISAYTSGDSTFLITANEGDDREETARIGSFVLDAGAFTNADDLKKNANLGRLNVSTIDGDPDQDGFYEALYSYGARSFSIWDVHGNRVFDSADQFEQIIAVQTPAYFNGDSGNPAEFDTRSDNKGPEPEGVALANLKGKVYAFIGLERAGGGIMVYDVSNPTAPELIEYVRADGDISPEGLLFIPAESSPNGNPLLVVTNELSKTVSLYEIQ